MIEQEVVVVGRVAWIVALVVLLLPGVGGAQTDTALERLPDVAIVVEALDDAAAKCNITASGLDAAVRVPLDASRLGIREPLMNTTDLSWLYVQVTALSQDVGCIARVDLELKRRVIVKSTGKTESGSVWQTGRLVAGPPYDFGERVNAAVREDTNKFLAEWIKQNPKPEAAF